MSPASAIDSREPCRIRLPEKAGEYACHKLPTTQGRSNKSNKADHAEMFGGCRLIRIRKHRHVATVLRRWLVATCGQVMRRNRATPYHTAEVCQRACGPRLLNTQRPAFEMKRTNQPGERSAHRAPIGALVHPAPHTNIGGLTRWCKSEALIWTLSSQRSDPSRQPPRVPLPTALAEAHP